MKIIEILKKVCNYLQLDDAKLYLTNLEKFNNNDLEQEPILDDYVSNDLKLLLECANNVCNHIATNYILLYNLEKIIVENDRYDVSKLKNKLFKVKKITKNNKKLNFSFIDRMLICESGEIHILYSYYPEIMKLEDECIDFNGRVGALGYCYGIASEFCLAKGDYEQAYFWDDKYKELLKNCSKRIDNFKIMNRRWY